MTLLGELYANGQGVNRDDKKAAEWYKQAADRGDREATFALAMLRMAGRGRLACYNRRISTAPFSEVVVLPHPFALESTNRS